VRGFARKEGPENGGNVTIGVRVVTEVGMAAVENAVSASI